MTNLAKRAHLVEFINNTDDKKVEALYVLLQNDIYPPNYYTSDDLNMLHERAEKYLKGEGKTYTVSESHNMIREQKKR